MDEMSAFACEVVEREGFASKGDTIMVAAGTPIVVSGTTNMLKDNARVAEGNRMTEITAIKLQQQSTRERPDTFTQLSPSSRPRIRLAGMPFDFGDHPARLGPGSRLIG
jgi:hypothetical protein